MSFFGFDPSAPPHLRNDGGNESYDFQETYDGLGDELDEADDIFNSETFGIGGDVGKDFDFSNTAGATPNHASSKQSVSYAEAASHAPNDDGFMEDLWGASNAPSQSRMTQSPADNSSNEKKIFSLEEIEAQLTAMDPNQGQVPSGPLNQPYGIPGMMPTPQFGGYMMQPPNVMPPQPAPGQFGQFPPGVLPPGIQIQTQPMQGPMGVQPQPQQLQRQPQPQAQPQPSLQLENLSTSNKVAETEQRPDQKLPSKVDLSNFPVLGSKEGQRVREDHRYKQHSYHQPHANVSHFSQNASNANLSPEEQAKLACRQEKVARIMKYSGIMNPKDKDFVTRFQLSQIVTDDPYNEDFYAQVFKVIHSKNNAPLQPNSQQLNEQHNSIAQAYLDQSGHRLGGRYKRADVALQRMQQQVQKAVTVAKERPKLTQYAREGALGKISIGNGKKPRQQLEIFSRAVLEGLDKESGESDLSVENASKEKANEVDLKSTRVKSPSISAPKKATKKYSKRDIKSILETIISNLMNVESDSRLSSEVDTTGLWSSLHVLDHPSTSGDEALEVNPFIQCLNYNKMLKVLSRLFKFLTREQVLTIVTLIMSNLENLSVIKNGSYTTYPDKKVPESILKLVEAYTFSFNKVLMNAVQDFKFSEIIGLLVILIEHNNVSFVSTTKIGLTILTTLLSRAELIKGEGTISATDLSEWSSCYDELFTSLESRIAAIFPPHPDDVDDGSLRENYVWQFLATLSLGGKLNHQRIIVDEVRDEIFGVMNRAKAISNSDLQNILKKQNLLNNLNMYLVVMGLVADENEIKEL